LRGGASAAAVVLAALVVSELVDLSAIAFEIPPRLGE